MIILMGLAGSGKSTQGQKLAAATGRVWLSAGQILRDSGQFDEILSRGELVDDMLTVEIMAQAMARVVREGKNVILDGFPRDKEQASWMTENIAEVIEGIIVIDVPKDELLRRLAARGRADDNEETIRQRFAITEQNMGEISRILGAKGVETVVVDGMGTPEEVFERLSAIISERFAGA